MNRRRLAGLVAGLLAIGVSLSGGIAQAKAPHIYDPADADESAMLADEDDAPPSTRPAGPASASGAGQDPLAAAAAALAGKASGISLLQASMPESQVRKLIAKAAPGTAFVVEPGAVWTLTATLNVPAEVTIIGFNPGRARTPTFIKGFDGPLMTIHSFVTLHGIVLHGNRKLFKGDGVVATGKGNSGVREVRLIRVGICENEGDGYVMEVPHYHSHFQFCNFDHNNGYATVYGEVRSHHTDNFWEDCHYSMNGKGGVAFHGVETDSIWDNCEWFHNGGPAFEQFEVTRKTGPGEMGVHPHDGAEVINIRSCIFRECAGPVWLQRGGESSAIAFEDCRMKHNGDPSESGPTKDSGKTAEQLLGLTAPASGLFHVEGGQLCVELRGGLAYDNGPWLFSAGPKAKPGCRLTVGGAGKAGCFSGGTENPAGFATILDRSLLKPEAVIHVKSGIALDPTTGETVKLGGAGAGSK
ncbi:MAG: hypothetical protein NTW19_14180 [Planctomycetota bacterium]|nr:hypothetical protein [Planctomycetota bacterium]